MSIIPQYTDLKVILQKPYAHLQKGTVCEVLFKVSDELDDFYVVQCSEAIFPISIPLHYFQS